MSGGGNKIATDFINLWQLLLYSECLRQLNLKTEINFITILIKNFKLE